MHTLNLSNKLFHKSSLNFEIYCRSNELSIHKYLEDLQVEITDPVV